MWLYVLSVVVPVYSQSAQAVAGKETFSCIKAAGACINDGRVNGHAHSRRETLPALPKTI